MCEQIVEMEGNIEHDIRYNKLKNNDTAWIPLLRQIFIISGVWTNSFMFGLNLGAPTVLIPQIRREANSTDAISIHMESWLSSVMGFSALPSVVILTALAHFIGRKRTCLIISVTSIAGFILFYCSTDVTQILISQMIHGLLVAAPVTTSLMIPSEYVSPKYRGVLVALEKTSIVWGIWISNAIGTFTYWKNIGLLGIICSIYYIINVLFWCESPYWLLSKSLVDESIVSHRWLKGKSEESERELENLMQLKEEYNKQLSVKEHVANFFQVIKLPEVYKSLALCALCICMFHLSGKFVCGMYSIKIIKSITDSEFTAYTGMLVLDGVTVFSMYCGCFLMNYFKRRTFILTTTAFAVTFLYFMALYLYLIKLNVIYENKYVSIGLLTAFSIPISLGPITMSGTLLTELIPLKSRSIGVCLLSFFSRCLMSIMLKISPYSFIVFEFFGTFLIFAISCSVCLLLTYKYLPETKNKTLVEISEILKTSPKNINYNNKELRPLKSETDVEETQ